jgi:hypothetical protein
MSSSNYPTVNYNVFIPSNWSSSNGGGFTEAELNKKYLRFPIAQTNQVEVLNNVTLNGVMSLYNSNNNALFGSNSSYVIGSNNTCLGIGALGGSGNINNSSNTCIGYNAGYGILATIATQGSKNTCIGTQAGYGITNGFNNTCIGNNTLQLANYVGSNNTLIGESATSNNVANSNSTAIGAGATITGNNQVVLGTASETVIVPNRALPIRASNNSFIITNNAIPVTGGYNIGIGSGAVQTLTSGTNNVFLGANALQTITANTNNTAIGNNSLATLTGDPTLHINNTAIGNTSASNFYLGSNNTFLGANTQVSSSAITYTKSTAVGHGANITASNQVVLGTTTETVSIPSGFISVPGGTNNIFFSSNSKFTLGNYNVGIGLATLQGGNTSTAQNNAVGYGALQNSKALNNTAFGHYALPNVTTGGTNTAIGANAGGINGGIGLTIGTNNTFLGADTNVAVSATAYNKSTAIGSGAIITASNQIVMGTATETVSIPGLLNTTSSSVNNPIKSSNTNSNMLFGSTTNLGLVTGVYNTCLGYDALKSLDNSISNSNNTVIGSRSLQTITSGSDNTIVGSYSAGNMISGGSMTLFGSGCGGGVVSGCSRLTMFGSASGIDIYGNSYNNSTAIGFNSLISGNNQVVLGTATESVVIPAREIIGLAKEVSNPLAIPFDITSITGTTMITTGNPPLTYGMSIYGNLILYNTVIVSGSGNTWEVSVSHTSVGVTKGLYGISSSFKISSITGTTMITTGNPPLSIGMFITGQGISSTGVTNYAFIVSGSGNSWVLSTSSTITTPITGFYQTTTSFSILSITGTNMITSGLPTLSTNMAIYGPGIVSGASITSGSGNNWFLTTTQTVGAITGYYPSNSINMVSLNNGSGGTGTILTTTGSPPLGVGMYLSGSGLASYTRIVAVTGPNTFTVSIGNNLGSYVLNYILPHKVSFPAPEIHYVIPNSNRFDFPLYIQLPQINDENISTKTSFRTVGTNSPVTGSPVLLISTNDTFSSVANIFNSTTSSTPVSNHQLYSTASNALLSHTFYVLPTSLSITGYGWFQQGAV